jgi:membrane protein YqaA with SNARE-associated domain
MSQELPLTPPEATPPADSTPAKAPSRVKGILTFLLAVGISLTIVFLTTRFHHELRGVGNAGYLGLFVISVIGNATIIIPAPVFVMACVAGTIYGPVGVGLVAGLGAALGELTGYYAGYGGAAVIPEGRLYLRLEAFMRRHGILTIFLLAAIPNPIFDMGGMLAGILKMPVLKFVAAAWLGKAIRLGVTAWVCMGGLPFLQQLFTPR